MYQKPTLLSSTEHRGVKLAPVTNFEFAAGMNSALLAGRELHEAAKDYPVIFARNEEGDIIALAVLGLRNGSNLFIDDYGQWEDDCYIPALFRRYPFLLAELPGAEEGNLTVCVDAAFPGFGGDEGSELFDAEGNQTETMKHALNFLTEFQQELQRTRTMVCLLESYGLFKDITASFTLPDGEEFGFGNLLMVDEEKLAKLEDDKLINLVRIGGLASIYAHLVSITNFRHLMRRENLKADGTARKNAGHPERNGLE